jgi:hypothetical protein
MVKTLLPLLLTLAGCGAVAEETLLAELRVVSLRADPPYVDLLTGADVTATAWTPDEAIDLLVWTCTPGGELPCAEAGAEATPQPLSTIATLANTPEVTHAVTAPASRPGAGGGGPPDGVEVDPTAPIVAGPPAFAWALACAPGTCDLMAEIAADPAPGTDAWRAIVDQLADPFALLETLPKVGTAATFRVLDTLLVLPGVTAPTNPVVIGPVAAPARLTVASGGSLELTFQVVAADAVTVYPATTAGGFALAASTVRDGVVTVELIARDGTMEEGPGIDAGTILSLYLVFEAEDGVSGLWTGEVTVE